MNTWDPFVHGTKEEARERIKAMRKVLGPGWKGIVWDGSAPGGSAHGWGALLRNGAIHVIGMAEGFYMTMLRVSCRKTDKRTIVIGKRTADPLASIDKALEEVQESIRRHSSDGAEQRRMESEVYKFLRGRRLHLRFASYRERGDVRCCATCAHCRRSESRVFADDFHCVAELKLKQVEYDKIKVDPLGICDRYSKKKKSKGR